MLRSLTRLVQARDLDLDGKPRSDKATRFAFQKLTPEESKARATESFNRIALLKTYIDKQYWTEAQNEARARRCARSLRPVASVLCSCLSLLLASLSDASTPCSCAARWARCALT